MFDRLKKMTLAAALMAATFVAAAAPAEARDRYGRGGGDDAAIAIGAGIIGLAVGAAIASDRNDRYYRPRGYYRSYPDYYYQDSYPRYRNNYYRDSRRDYRRNWRRENRNWNRGYDGNYRRHYRY